MSPKVHIHRLANGLTLLIEPMPWLESAAFSLLTPAGSAREPAEFLGLGSLTCELAERGCGDRDSHEFLEALELLGAETSSSVSTAHTSFGGAAPADRLAQTLELYADLVQRAHLQADELEDARQSCVQEIRSLEDDLAQRVTLELRRLSYPDPLSRSSIGTIETIESITHDDVAKFYHSLYCPTNAILSIAGKVDVDATQDLIERLFGEWQPRQLPPIVETAPSGKYEHIQHESSQTHIAVSFPSVPYPHPDYFQARGAVGVLSDGMSSRLFTEVREKRGLCYTVYATCHSLKKQGSIVAYAGTTTERAQETLNVMVGELVRLSDGIQGDELQRLKARIKTSLIMQQESSNSRSSSIAGDWYFLERVRTLDEISRIIDDLSCDSINAYLAANRPNDFRVVTLGQSPLEMPSEISSAQA